MNTALESMMDEVFTKDENLYSEEVYFGLKHPFSQEMINHVKRLREELRKLLGANWKDERKRAILVKNEFKGKTSYTDLIQILDDMGSCVARHCNIEKCYIGIFEDVNAHTIPLCFDSSILFKSKDDAIYKKFGKFFVNEKKIRAYKDIQSQLMKIDDICLNKNGYKFKDKSGKVFVINIGLPLLVDNEFESSPEEICSVLFHEIGHNFQQILHGSNQMLIDYYIRAHLNILRHGVFFGMVGMMEYSLIKSHLSMVIKHVGDNNLLRFSIIKSMLLGNVLIDRHGNIQSRDELGKTERENIKAVIDYARDHNLLTPLSITLRILGKIFSSFVKILSLVFSPITSVITTINDNDFNKSYHEVMFKNKMYEQFADTFAIAYGFGGDSSKFYIKIQEMIKKSKQKKASISHFSILNNVPVLSEIDALNRLRETRMNIHVAGYDEDYVRIAQIYKVLDHELSNNKDLTSQQKKEIIEHMEVVKEDYEKFKKLEMENFGSNPSITKKLIKKMRSGDIKDVATESGIVELVLEVVDEYEKNGNKIKEPPVVKNFKELNSISSKAIDKIEKKITGSLDFLKERLSLVFRIK